MIVFLYVLIARKTATKMERMSTDKNERTKKNDKEGKRNLSGDEGGNCYNIYKHEIYISIAASYAVMLLLLFDDVVCLWRQLRSHTDIEKNTQSVTKKKINSIFHLMSQKSKL